MKNFKCVCFGMNLMLVGGFICGGMIGSASEGGDEIFKQYVVELEETKGQTVLNGHFLDRAVAEFVVVSVDENDAAGVKVFTFQNESWKLVNELKLDAEVEFVDVMNLDGLDRFVFYQEGEIYWLDFETEKKHKLVQANSSFENPRESSLPHVDVSHDLDGDGFDDLVLLNEDGFQVFVQLEDCVFADPIEVKGSTDMRRISGTDGYRFDPWSQSRVHQVDYNQDGLNDLVYWDDGFFKVHFQNEEGFFTASVKSFKSEVTFDSDDLSILSEGEMNGRVLYSIKDLNGDGYADLVNYSLEGSGISSKRSWVEIYFGSSSEDGRTVFESEAGAVLKTEDEIIVGIDFADLDRDGALELMLTSIAGKHLTGNLWKSFKGLMGDDIRLNYQFYRLDDGVYPDQPNAVRRIGLFGAPTHTEPGFIPLEVLLKGGKHEDRMGQEKYDRTFNTNCLLGDVTGDGISDLMIEYTFRDLDLFVGVEDEKLLSDQTKHVRVGMPSDEELSWLADLNQDGKKDILMHFPYVSEAFSPHQTYVEKPCVKILIGR